MPDPTLLQGEQIRERPLKGDSFQALANAQHTCRYEIEMRFGLEVPLGGNLRAGKFKEREGGGYCGMRQMPVR